jgi:hypothetical protein
LYETLQRVLANERMAASLGRAARRTVEARYSRETVASRYTELFSSLHAIPARTGAGGFIGCHLVESQLTQSQGAGGFIGCTLQRT